MTPCGCGRFNTRRGNGEPPRSASIVSARLPDAAVAHPRTGIKGRYRSFVERHDVAWELFFAALAVVFVALAFVPVVPGSPTDEAIFTIEWLITGVFIAEFSSRLWAAES